MNTVTHVPNTFTDDMAVDCARLSFNSRAENHTPEQNARLIDYLVRNKHINPFFHPMATVRLSQSQINLHQLVQNKTLLAGLNLHKDGKEWIVTTSAWGLMELVRFMNRYTWMHNMPAFSNSYARHINTKDNLSCAHFRNTETPHHHQWFSFMFETDMATKAQLYTHTVGLAKSSQSYRYIGDDKEVDGQKVTPIKFYTPNGWRGKADNAKQGSSNELVPENMQPYSYDGLLHDIAVWYTANQHICNEQRRLILLQAQMSKYVITGTREAWERVLRLRNAPEAQKEVRDLMPLISDTLQGEWA